MNYKYILSIIIPAYNIENYLVECIESIIPQLNKDVEIVIINDCSTDSTPLICNNYQSKYRNIKVIHNEVCRGVSVARNLGLSVAEGQYISFVDGDDLISSSYIENILFCINNYNVEMMMFDYTRQLNLLDIHPIQNSHISLIDGHKVFEGILGKEKNDGYLWNKIFKNEIIKNNSISFPENITIWEDMLFVLRYLKVCKIILDIDQRLYFYRIRSDSATNSSISAKTIKDKISVCKQFLLLDADTNSTIHKQATYLLSINSIDLLIYYLKNKKWNEIENLNEICFSVLKIRYKLKYTLLVIFLFIKKLFNKV